MNTDARTAGDDANGDGNPDRASARPARIAHHDLSTRPLFSASGYAHVMPGGASYVEIELPPNTPSIDIIVEPLNGSAHIRASAMLTSTYPQLCQAPAAVAMAPPQVNVDVASNCTRLVLVLASTDRPGAEAAQQMRWTIRPQAAIDGVLIVDGPPLNVTATANEPQQYRFTGQAGQRLHLGMSDSTFPGAADFRVLGPSGAQIASLAYSSSVGGRFGDIDLAPLSADGVYTVVVDPNSNGSVTLTLSTTQTSSLAIDGSSVPLTFDRPGQDARLQFTGQAGQLLRVRALESTIVSATVSVLNPSGAQLTSRTFGRSVNGSFTDIDIPSLPANGSYIIVVNPNANGSVFMRLMTRA